MKPAPKSFASLTSRMTQLASPVLAMLLSFQALAQGQTTNSAANDAANKARAENVLKQTREALGGEANLAAIKSMAISGDFRSVVGGREIKGDLKIEMLFPEKSQRTVRSSAGPMLMTRIDTANGNYAWRDTKREMGAVGGGMDGGGFGGGAATGGGGGAGGGGGGAGGGGGFGGGGGGGGGGRGGRGGGGLGGPSGGPANNGLLGEDSPEIQKQIKDDFARILIMLLAGASASSSFEYAYDRELEAKDGKVDVIRVTNKEDFATWVMIDQKTHRPLMMVYRAAAPRSPRQQNSTIAGEFNDEPKFLDYQLFLSDYKQEGNVWLPHQIIRAANNQQQEEWKLKKFKINPDLKANKFEKKK
jgi:hypothetical protein